MDNDDASNDFDTAAKRHALKTQSAIPNVKSGQACVVVPGLYTVNYPEKIVEFASKFKDKYCTDLVIKSGKNCVPEVPEKFRLVGVTDDRWKFDEVSKTVTITNGVPGHKVPSFEGGRTTMRYAALPLVPGDAHPPMSEAEINQYFLHPL